MNNNYFAILPLNLIYDEKYADISMRAIILYSLFLNRKKISLQNKKFKDNNGVFIYYSTEQISSHLHCSLNSAKKVLSELEQIGLIRRKYQQNGLPLKIYVNDIRAENKGTYSPPEKPQDKLLQTQYLKSNYNNKPHTDHSVQKEKDVSFDVEKALTQKQINRRNFGNKKRKKTEIFSQSS